MPNLLGPGHIWIILLIVVLLFGATQLPKLAKSLGQSMRIFRGEMRSMNEESAQAKAERSAESGSAESGSAGGTGASGASAARDAAAPADSENQHEAR